MQTSAALAYQQTARKAVSPRELEADLLLNAAAKLQTVIDAWQNDPDPRMLDHALIYNRKLWQVFATSVTAAENPLPNALKESVANLAIFVFNRTMDATADRDPAKMAPVVNINRQVAAGLRGQ